MTKQFLPLKIAIHDYTVSLITLRRLVREIVKDANHKHRHFVRPTAEEYRELKEKHSPFEYEIDTQLLNQKYTQRVNVIYGGGEIEDHRADAGGAAMNLIDNAGLLRDQLIEKDKQIEKLSSAIESFARTQEFQSMIEAKRLGLPVGTSGRKLFDEQKNQNDEAEAITVAGDPKRKAPAKADAAKPKPPKRGVFRIFGRSKKQTAGVR